LFFLNTNRYLTIQEKTASGVKGLQFNFFELCGQVFEYASDVVVIALQTSHHDGAFERGDNQRGVELSIYALFDLLVLHPILDDLDDRSSEGVQDFQRFAFQYGAGVVRLDGGIHQGAASFERWVGNVGFEEPKDGAQLPACCRLGLYYGSHLRVHRFRHGGKRLPFQFFLVLEVAVYSTLGEARRVGDVAHRRSLVSTRVEQHRRALQDTVLRVLRV